MPFPTRSGSRAGTAGRECPAKNAETMISAVYYIFLVLQGGNQEKARQTLEKAVLSNPAWQQLTAVKEGRCHYMDQALYN